ncbi:MAG: hypothetical protein ACYC7E_05370 [Armatimonadota bacterium]
MDNGTENKGTVRWEDMEALALNPSEAIRTKVIDQLFGPVADLINTDTERFCRILIAVAEQYADYTAGRLLAERSEDDILLEIIWPEMLRLLDKNDTDLNTMLLCAYFEHVIPEHNWGPDDPHLLPMISATGSIRQWTLLAAAAWQGLEEGRFREIVQALLRAKDAKVASIARGIIEGRIRYSDQAGGFVTVRAGA